MKTNLKICAGALLALALPANALAASYKPFFRPYQSWQEISVAAVAAALISGLIWWKLKIGRPAQVLVILLIWNLLVTAHLYGSLYWAASALQLLLGIAAYLFI
jgi:hypothetical protein